MKPIQKPTLVKIPFCRAGFTRLEALVVALVLLILFVVIAPLCLHPSASIERARATAMKNWGRGIWVGITSSWNSEFPPLPLWPADLIEELRHETNSCLTADSTAEDYFTFLMSDYNAKPYTATITLCLPKRLVSSFSPRNFSGPGVLKSDGIAFGPEYNAWHVALVGDDDPGEMPFLVTRNVKTSTIDYALNEEFLNFPNNSPLVKLADYTPFKTRRAVWVTKGGSTFDALPRDLRKATVCPVLKPREDAVLKFLKSGGGAQD